MYNFRLTGNRKTGVMPMTRSPQKNCPDTCNLKGNGCYAETGMIAMHWKKDLIKGISFLELINSIKKLPKNILWRHNEAGDLSQKNGKIDFDDLVKLVEANKNKRGFTYTHHNPIDNADYIRYANDNGFVVNLSSDNASMADTYKNLNIGPVVTILPLDAPNVSFTPQGNKIVACPAEKSEKVKCANCALCALPKRDYIIGFRAHGVRKKTVNKIAVSHL